MKLGRRHMVYLIAISLLALILVIKRFGHFDSNTMHEGANDDHLTLEEYAVYAEKPASLSRVRNIFSSTRTQATEQRQRLITPLQAKKQTTETQENKNQATDNISDAVKPTDELVRIRLLGIVFHDNKKRAFLALDKQRVIADVGDIVYGRYLLRDIAVNSAELIDTKENQQRTIMVSGK